MFYSVHKGINIGIFESWKECEQSVKGYPNAIFKKFKNKKDAEFFLKNGKDIPKKKKIEIVIDTKNEIPNGINVFTDGSRILKNKNYYGGYGIYFGNFDERNIGEIYNDGEITNNRAELYAILKSLEILKKNIDKKEKINIFTDSEYSLKSVTEWYKNWEKNNWKDNDGNDRKNIDYIKPISDIIKKNKNINLHHVKSHTNNKDFISLGNQEADKLAVKGAKKNFE